MCQDGADHALSGQDADRRTTGGAVPGGPFPWDAGIFDAHCHPTDTMASIDCIPSMKARVLTIMATRSQDQHLVESVAAARGLRSRTTLASEILDGSQTCVVPAFGWHPWFSHQLYDDMIDGTPPHDAPSDVGRLSTDAHKMQHYMAVLTPPPADAFIQALPQPVVLSAFISATRQRLEKERCALVGEVGLDHAFRLPEAWSDDASRHEGLTPGGREGRRLSPYHVIMSHQQKILTAQLRLAAEMQRPVSVHGVQAHGVLFDTLSCLWKGHEREVVSKRQQKRVAPGAEDFSDFSEDEKGDGHHNHHGANQDAAEPITPYPPRICLHSFSGPPQIMKQWLDRRIPATIFFSFSVAVNLSTPKSREKLADLIRTCPDQQLLIESDLHIAGPEMDNALENMYRTVCDIKGWPLRQGTQRIAQNYERFIFGC